MRPLLCACCCSCSPRLRRHSQPTARPRHRNHHRRGRRPAQPRQAAHRARRALLQPRQHRRRAGGAAHRHQAADANYAPAYSMFGLVYMELKENTLRRGELRARAAPRAERRRHQPQLRLVPVPDRARAGIDQVFPAGDPQPALPYAVALLFGGRRVHAAQEQAQGRRGSSSSARSSSSPTSPRRCCQPRPDPLPPGQHRRGAQAGDALQQAGDADRRVAVARGAHRAQAGRARRRSRPSPTSCAAASRTRANTRRCSEASMTDGVTAAVSDRRRAGACRCARGAGPRARRRRAAAQVRAAPDRGARAGALRRAARRRPSRAAWCAATRACSSSIPSRCCSAWPASSKSRIQPPGGALPPAGAVLRRRAQVHLRLSRPVGGGAGAGRRAWPTNGSRSVSPPANQSETAVAKAAADRNEAHGPRRSPVQAAAAPVAAAPENSQERRCRRRFRLAAGNGAGEA